MTFSSVRTVLDIDGIPVTVEYIRERPSLWPFHSDKCTVLDVHIEPCYLAPLRSDQVECLLAIARQLTEGVR